jgi:hypothetical protein
VALNGCGNEICADGQSVCNQDFVYISNLARGRRPASPWSGFAASVKQNTLAINKY